MLRVLPLVALAGCASLLGIDALDERNISVDAAPTVDAAAPIDAPTPLTGLGAPCSGDSMCKNNTLCIGALGFCSNVCEDDVVFTTDANGAPISFTPDPLAQDGVCVGLFKGDIGTPSCALIQNINPPLPFEPDTTYSADFFCVLRCQVDAECPAELSCDTSVGGACLPRAAP